MEHPPVVHHEEPALDDAAIDRLVDMGVGSYFAASGRAAVERAAALQMSQAPRPRDRGVLPRQRRAAAQGPQYGEETGVGYPDGVPPELRRREPLSEEQIERNTYNRRLIDEQFGWKTRDNK